MADLDLSRHTLNLSGTKQRYSFPRTDRFISKDKPLCDSLYDMPNSLSKRGTSLGYGNKKFGDESTKFVPGVGAYNFNSDINPEKNQQKSFTFGVSRENMEQSGALGLLKYLEKMPAPGNYKHKDVNDYRSPTMRARHPDHDFERSTKNPGPGTYNHQKMGSSNYYLTSQNSNHTNVNISKVSRLEPLSLKPKVGPSDYSPVDELNGGGRYKLARHKGVNSCVFSRSERKGPIEKNQLSNPGPGAYKSFSSFS